MRNRNSTEIAFVSAATMAMALAAGAAHAQESGSSGGKSEILEEVSITGSRIRGAAPVGSPLILLDQEAINTSNLTTVDRLIAQSPQVFDLGVSEASRSQNGGAGNIVYSNGVNLRGIGPYATLVLLDGHRAVSNGRAIDPSMMPSLGLQRIEILADGASAVYGSDAIAGVVNMIPVRGVDGAQILGRYGFADGYSERQLGFAYGKTWDSGQVHLAYENGFRSNLNGGDRDFFRADQRANSGRDYRSTLCDPPTLRIGTVDYAVPAGGVTTANRGSLVAGTTNACESVDQDLLPEQKYNSVAVTFNQKFNDWLEFVSDGFFAERKFFREVAFSGSDLTVPSTNAFYVTPVGSTATSETLRYRFTELPQDSTWGHARNWEFTGGLRASLPADWRVEGLMTYGENRDLSTSLRGLNTVALNAALASGNPALAFDPYGLKRTSASVLAGISDQIFLAPTNSEFKGYELRFDGPVITIPGGKIRAAVGAERQEHDYHAGSARGGPTTPVVFRDFDRSVNSAYAEVLVPVFGADNSHTGLKRLELTAALRFDDYSDVGNTTNPKFGLNYAPTDSLTLRASYGTSLRAPIFAELYGNSSNFFVGAYSDPTLNGASVQGVALSGGNTALKPEEATTYTVGFEWSPEALVGLRLSGTYFDIEYDGQIAAYLGDTTVLGKEALFAGTGIILRGAAAAARIAELQAQGITSARGAVPANPTVFVDGRPSNLGVSITRGIDLSVAYAWDTGLGNFSTNVTGTYLTAYEVAQTPIAPTLGQLDNIFNPLELKVRASLNWNVSRYRSQLAVSHVGGYNNSLIVPNEGVASYTPVDLSVAVTLGDTNSDSFLGSGFILGVDARNVFDVQPPYVNIGPTGNGSGGFDATAVNPVGRTVGVSIRKSW